MYYTTLHMVYMEKLKQWQLSRHHNQIQYAHIISMLRYIRMNLV